MKLRELRAEAVQRYCEASKHANPQINQQKRTPANAEVHL